MLLGSTVVYRFGSVENGKVDCRQQFIASDQSK